MKWGVGDVSEIKDRYSVGEAARLSNVSKKTLRYYDEIQLIIPDIDENNNYRYYTKDQIQDIITTKKLKNAGLKLNEIRDYLQKNQRQDKVQLLNRKIEDCSRELTRLRKSILRLSDFRDRLSDQFYDNLSSSAGQVQRELYSPGLIAFSNHYSSAYVSNLFLEYEIELENYMDTRHLEIAGKLTAFFYDHFSHQFFDIPTHFQIFYPIKETQVRDSQIKVMPEYPCLTTIHLGSYKEIMEAYHRTLAYAKEKGIMLTGQSFESYFIGPNLIKNADEFVTKIHMVICQNP